MVVVAEQPLALEQGLEPFGELALKNPRQIPDQLFQRRQLLLALGQLLTGGRQGSSRGWVLARGARAPWGRLLRGGWGLQGTGARRTSPIFAKPRSDWDPDLQRS